MNEELIKLIEDNGLELHGEIEYFAELVRADEREACAQVCEQLGMATNGMNERNYECATAIRARGEK
jgi:hypothetical protein